jgi:hypothetical protein
VLVLLYHLATFRQAHKFIYTKPAVPLPFLTLLYPCPLLLWLSIHMRPLLQFKSVAQCSLHSTFLMKIFCTMRKAALFYVKLSGVVRTKINFTAQLSVWPPHPPPLQRCQVVVQRKCGHRCDLPMMSSFYALCRSNTSIYIWLA